MTLSSCGEATPISSAPYDDGVSPRIVYLHIGPPKTGTTYVQDVLWRNRSLLERRGLTFPGSRPVDHFHAALDLRGVAFGGHANPAVDGAWRRLTAQTASVSTPKVVVSHEMFAGADEDQIARAVHDLEPAKVHVVYGARDLARQLPAVWQESLKNRRTRTYGQFLANALSDESADHQRGFWRSQHPVETLGRWSRHVERDHIHLVTFPQRGASPSTLWERFCTALGVDAAGFDLDVARSNTSMSPLEAEVLRRLNTMLPGELEWPAYERMVKRWFNQLVEQGGSDGRLPVPRRYQPVVQTEAERIVADLAGAGYDIVGQLDELLPAESSFGPLPQPGADEVADGAVRLLGRALVEVAEGRPRRRSLADSLPQRRGHR